MQGPFDRFGIDPIGTAGTYAAFVLVEWPLPWRRDLFDDDALLAVAERVQRAEDRGEPTRVLACVPSSGEPGVGGHRRVIRYRRVLDAGPYVRTEAVVPDADLLDVVVDVVDGADPSPSHDPGPVRDLLVCTHGARDTRCGSLGTRLHESVRDRWPDVRVWRISHTGGHRFAPTGISFPEGWFWSNLDPGVVESIVSRSGDPAQLAHHLRGNAAVAKPAQVVDRLGFLARGWPWVDEQREVVASELGDGLTEVVVGGASGRVGVRRRVPTIACDSLCDDPTETTPELGLV